MATLNGKNAFIKVLTVKFLLLLQLHQTSNLN